MNFKFSEFLKGLFLIHFKGFYFGYDLRIPSITTKKKTTTKKILEKKSVNSKINLNNFFPRPNKTKETRCILILSLILVRLI